MSGGRRFASMRAGENCSRWFLKRWRVPLVPVLLAIIGVTCQLISFAHNSSKLVREPESVPVRAAPQIPLGYILPAKLDRTLSVNDARAGDAIEARIMQEVPLPNREKIAFRSVVKGSVLAVSRDDDEIGVRLTIRFDQVTDRGQNLSIATSLRAIASHMAVHDAQMPLTAYDEATPLSWANTVQIGGDVRFGDGDSVRNRWKETVGKAVPGGVLVYARANPELGCDKPVPGDDHVQALWVFSADACGVYGLKGVKVTHNGQSPPIGEITLHFEKASIKLRAGTGILLRVVSHP